MSRWFREGAPRDAPITILEQAAYTPLGFALSRIILSTNVFSLLENTVLA